MILISYLMITCLAMAYSALDTFILLDQGAKGYALDASSSSITDGSRNILNKRGTGSKKPPSSSSPPRVSPTRLSRQPASPSLRSTRDVQDTLRKSSNSSSGLSFQASKSPAEASEQINPKQQTDAVKPGTRKSMQDLGQTSTSRQSRQGLIKTSIPFQLREIQKRLKDAGNAATAPTTLTQSRVSGQNTRASGSNINPVDPKMRIAQDSGATPSVSSMIQKNAQDVSVRASKLSLEDQARMIEHHEWLAEAQKFIGKAEQAWKRMPKANRRSVRSHAAETDAATTKAAKSRAHSEQAREEAKRAIAKADELLRSEPASSAKAQECLSSTNQQARTACAAGAVHAGMERKAAMVAQDARRWDLVASHSKANARAMTRARAFEEQNYSYQAQYRAKAARERARALPKDDPSHKEAEKQAILEQKEYERSALFYHSVHDQYRQTRGAFPGSESEDEERVFPDISYPAPKP